MKKILLLSLLSFSFAVYNIGQTVSTTDQQITKSTCFAGNGYEDTCDCNGSQENCSVGGDWSLADWNGATNGGHYNVIFIEMSATW
jgi:hypothetical protein